MWLLQVFSLNLIFFYAEPVVAVEHPLVSGGGECTAEAGLPGQGWPTVSRGEAWRGPGG